MKESEIKSKSRTFGKSFDLNSQEIEKVNFFLLESELKDFNGLIYLSSSINKKYTALLYREKDHSYLYLFILRHIIDIKKENITYKIKTKLKFNKSEIDKTNFDDKQIFIEDQANKNLYNEYSVTLINKDLVLLQVIGKKIMVINFDKKEYTILFCNSSDKKSIQVVSTYDELIVTKKENNSLKKYQIRTYIFCISSGKLYFFMINDKVFQDFQFLLIPFPFGEDYSDCIDFEILKISNKKEINENSNIKQSKYYFVFIVLLNGKFIRYVTDWINCGLKDILLNFHSNLERGLIQRSIDHFDKGNNNCGLKVYRSEKCASYIILQIGFHIFTFKYYETDSPEEIMKRFGITNNKEENIILNNSNQNIKNEGEINDVNSVKNIIKMNNSILNTLNESLSISKTSLFNQKARHGSLANVVLPQLSSTKISPKVANTSSTSNIRNNQVSVESISSNKLINSLDRTESNIIFTDTKDKTAKEGNFQNKNISMEIKNSSMPEFKTKDKGVVYFSLEKYYDLNFNEENYENEEYNKNLKENINEENSKLNESYSNQSKNIIYSFTCQSFISFIQTTNNVLVSNIPEKSKEQEGVIEKVMNYHSLTLNYDKIEILDILHYQPLKYSYLLTNKYIFKFRVNTDLFHLLNFLNKHKSNNLNLADKRKDSIYYKLKSVFKFSRSNKLPFDSKCKLCKKRESKLICPKCKRAVYCCNDHMEDDFRNIHFFQCEMNICIEKLEKEKRKNESLSEINAVIISFKNIINQIFIFIENKKDYINYTIYLKIMLNILVFIDIEGFISKILSPMRTKLSNDFRKVCDKIFIIELWFFYCNLNILYITFLNKGGNYLLSTHLLNFIKIIELIEKKDAKIPTLFAYFSLANELTKYKINNREEIEVYSKNFFFNLLKIYTNDNKNNEYLYIHEQFFIYYLHTFSSLLKIHLFLKEKTKTMKEVGTINIDKIVYYIPKLFEDKLNTFETNDINLYPIKFPLIIIYYYLSFILVKIDRISNAINLLRYILADIQKINNHKDIKQNELNNNISYLSLEAKIYLNIGILMNYDGEFNLGIHHLENCYRLCFQEKLSMVLTMKVLDLLCLAYINNDKIDTAFILVKHAISLKKKFLSDNKKKFNTTMLIYKLDLYKLKIYLLFIYQYLSFKYQKMNNFLNLKSTKTKTNVIKNPDDIPNSVLPIEFNKISPGLIGYVCEEDKKKKKAELLKDKINKDDENFKFELESNLDKFVIFCYSGKLEMIIKALEFLYKLSEKEYEILNNDNGSIQKDDNKEDNYNLRERSSSVSRDFSMSYSKPFAYKDKLNFFFKEDNETYLDEIEVKMGLYDQLTDAQQKELKTIQNNIFRRSILLRDPKGRIDKFNLNYHPKYTMEFYELFTKSNETVFLNQLEKFGVGEQYEAKIFEHKSDGLIYSLRKYLNLEKIQNILYLQKVKIFEKYKEKLILVQKSEYQETINKNQIVANEYINKLKEKFSKDKFLKNMNLEGLYEKLVKELTIRELNYIIENPTKILNYIYINSKTFPDYLLNKTERAYKEESKKSSEESETSSNKSKDSSSKDKNNNKKEKKNVNKENNGNEEKNEIEKKSNLSPRTIYNNLIDLISEKRNERNGNKKKTVNFKNLEISNILDYMDIKDSKKTKNSINDNKKWFYRSVSLNKQDGLYRKKLNQRERGKSTTMRNSNSNSRFRTNSSVNFQNITSFNKTIDSKFKQSNYDNLSEIKEINELKRNNKPKRKTTQLKNSKKIIDNINKDNNINQTFLTINNPNNQKRKFGRDEQRKTTFILEETLYQKKKSDSNVKQNPINEINNTFVLRESGKLNNDKADSNKKGKKIIKRSSMANLRQSKFKLNKNKSTDNIEDSKIQNLLKENNNKILNKNDKNIIDENSKNEIKNTIQSFKREKSMKIEGNINRTIVMRQKPSLRELREKVLHRNSSIVSNFM